jgi:hypothetical protein
MDRIKKVIKTKTLFTVSALNKRYFVTCFVFALLNYVTGKAKIDRSEEMRRTYFNVTAFVPRVLAKVRKPRSTKLIVNIIYSMRSL